MLQIQSAEFWKGKGFHLLHADPAIVQPQVFQVSQVRAALLE